MGGAEIHLHEIFKRVAAKGHKVTLVAHHFGKAPNKEIIDNIEIIRIGNKFLFNRQFKDFYLRKLQHQKFDLIVDDISKIPLNTPQYIKKPIVGILHHIHGDSLYKEIPFPLAYYIIKSERAIPKHYSKTPIFTVSQSTKDELINLGQPKEKIGILHNAIDHELFNKVTIQKSISPLLVYVGRIKNYKNIDKIIFAVKDLIKDFPKIKLVIGGKGDYKEELIKLTSKLNLQNNIEFLGFLSEEKKAKLLAEAWIFITMAEKEGWGITVIEANAVKTPVIGSNVAGLKDSIRDNETGYLVPLNEQAGLVNKIRHLLNNKDELQRLSTNALKWSKEFTWEKSCEYFLEKIYEWYPNMKLK